MTYSELTENKDVDKKVEKVISGKAKVKENKTRKFANMFSVQDMNSVKSYILADVIVPATKKIISDVVDTILFGETRGSRNRQGSLPYVSYSSRYNSARRDDQRVSMARVGYNFSDVVVETEREAKDVVNQLYDMLERYGVVSVADLYETVGLPHTYTDNKYGWMGLRNVDIQRVRDGYVIKMPRANPLD